MTESINFSYVRRVALDRVSDKLKENGFDENVVSQLGELLNTFTANEGEIEKKDLQRYQTRLVQAIDKMDLPSEVEE